MKQLTNYIFKIYKLLIQLNIRKTEKPAKKQAEDLNRLSTQEDIKMAYKHMKRCSTTLIIREMHIKTTMRHYFTPIRMAIINTFTNKKFWRKWGGGK